MSDAPLARRTCLVVLALVIALGAMLRIVPSNGFKTHGPDEKFYAIFVNGLDEGGPLAYPQIFADYIGHQSKPESPLVLPPGRVAFIGSAWLWMEVTGTDALGSLRAVSALASIAILIVAAAFLWRAKGPEWAVGVTALLVCSPLQIHLAQRSLIDGFFAFWAMAVLWTLWECLQNPGHRAWLAAYGVSVAAMVLTKENAAFVMAGVGTLLVANRWLRFGHTALPLWISTAVAPLAAALILLLAAGGPDPLFTAYRLNVAKSVLSPYAIATGDGPWFRYLVDLCLLSPAVLVFALIGVGRLRKPDRLGAFFALFVAVTFLIMGHLRYGMNARYTNIWELALCYFAVFGALHFVAALPAAARRVGLVLAVVLLCLSGLAQYDRYFMAGGIYDPVPEAMERAALIIK